MAKHIKYSGAEKTFLVNKKKKRLKKEAKVIFALISFIIFFAISFILLNNSYNFGNTSQIISYSEKGSSGYKIYLKENSDFTELYYDENSDENAFIASLINSINVSFNYQFNSEFDYDLEYNYDVTADLYITDQDAGNVLLKETDVLLDNQKFVISNKTFMVVENVDIDYDYYNNYVNQFKNQYGVAIESKIVVTFKLNSIADSSLIDDDIVKDNVLTVEIPLSEQYVNIAIEASKIDNSEFVSDALAEGIVDNTIFVIAVSMGIISLLSLVYGGYITFNLLVKRDIYMHTVKKYLREYDRIIVTSSQPDLNETTFENKIRVMSIEELIDAHDATGNPIIYYEVIPNEKSYFIIIQGNILYKLTISRAFLEKENNGTV